MVLEGASSRSSDDAFTDRAPSSDVDRYDGEFNPTHVDGRESSYISMNPPGVNQIYVNISNLPAPWATFGRGSMPAPLVQSISDTGQQAARLLGRPLRQDEADALAYHRANAYSIASYGAPIGSSIAGVLAYRGWNKFRFPFWTPGEKFNPDSFLAFKGRPARIIWHFLRLNAYITLGMLAGNIFFGSYGFSTLAVNQMRDTRLKDMVNELAKQAKEHRANQVGIRGDEDSRVQGPRAGETYEMARQRQSAQAMSRHKPSASSAGSNKDDMSPTGGAFGQDFAENPDLDSGFMTDEQISQQTSREESANSPPLPSSQPSRFPSSSSSSPPSQSDNPSGSSGGSGGTGAWARLRQQASSSSQSRSTNSSAGNSETSASPLDGFSFPRSSSSSSRSNSSGDENEQSDRSRAQKEFDASVEREREGKNFEETRGGGGGASGSQRRW